MDEIQPSWRDLIIEYLSYRLVGLGIFLANALERAGNELGLGYKLYNVESMIRASHWSSEAYTGCTPM